MFIHALRETLMNGKFSREIKDIDAQEYNIIDRQSKERV